MENNLCDYFEEVIHLIRSSFGLQHTMVIKRGTSQITFHIHSLAKKKKTFHIHRGCTFNEIHKGLA
jgi:hypothetical protein